MPVNQDETAHSKTAAKSDQPISETTSAPQNDAEPKRGVTFASQDSLPKLPIPDLADSCRRYLEALEALQGAREHRETRSAVKDFQEKDGPELNERLKKYATGKSSYIEQFCESHTSHPRALAFLLLE